MKSTIHLVLIALGAAQLLGTIPNSLAKEPASELLCEVEILKIRNLTDQQTFDALYQAWENRHQNSSTSFVANPQDCQVSRHRINGYHSHAETDLIVFRTYSEWRGGVATSQVRLCKRTTRINNSRPETTEISYGCMRIEKN